MNNQDFWELVDANMAPKGLLASMSDEHTRLVEALSEVRGIEVLFSDESLLGDVFDGPDDPRIKDLEDELGIPLSFHDTVVEVCMRLRGERAPLDG